MKRLTETDYKPACSPNERGREKGKEQRQEKARGPRACKPEHQPAIYENFSQPWKLGQESFNNLLAGNATIEQDRLYITTFTSSELSLSSFHLLTGPLFKSL